MSSPNQTSQTVEEWLTGKEAAALLPYSLRTLQRAADRGEVVTIQSPGGRRRYLRTSVLALAEEQKAS